MWTQQKNAEGSATSYGLGWEIHTKTGILMISHEGGRQGTKAIIALVPNRRTGVIVLDNSDAVGSGIYTISGQLLKILLDIPIFLQINDGKTALQ